ncbi:NCS2 family permease [Falsibacillus albus]|uniref:NCS2 family permease n=1 Tax=Falsibacillus albus TaxID=2478915 RepID=A0A3L7K3E5_9BACI|nr:NCS2 family permease [Falsibacillus albus]RLQ95232.1 NCS2 family permease [Falsibacillus albus]
MKNLLHKRLFDLEHHQTTVKKELMAGLVGFFTIVYIIAVNSFILAEAGIPIEGAVLATILTSFAGCMVMGFWANAPILLVPGMGINALFTYTLVQSMELSWQEALAVVFVSGIAFTIISFTPLTKMMSNAIPQSLKDSITIGLGFFLMLIGLEKGGIVIRGANSIISLGDLSSPKVLATILTFLIAIILFLRNVKGNFLWSILIGTVIAALFGILPEAHSMSFSLSAYGDVFGGMSFDKWTSFPFWVAAFSITMVLVFENIGLVHGHTKFMGHPEKFERAFQANGISALLSGLLGSSPTVSTVESSAAIAAGGKTGLTSVTTGILFLTSILFIPYIKLMPDNAVAPILMLIGGLMVENLRSLDFSDLTEAFPSIFIIAMIPFTYSIADGIAIGFILYPILKLSIGKAKEVSAPLYIIAGLFLMNFIFHFIH